MPSEEMEEPKVCDKARVLELFSGIGGMHYGLLEANIPFEIKLAIDINDIANKVYQHNFPTDKIVSKNIKGLTTPFLNKLNINTILMSPPCQPFSRNGNFLDVTDARSDPFNHICELIPTLTTVDFILMENVVGFEKSVAHKKFLQVLDETGFTYHEYIMSPTHLGVPNTRHRYYCIARRGMVFQNEFTRCEDTSKEKVMKVKDFVERKTPEHFEAFLVSDKVLSTRYKVFDIVQKESTNSMCFTKAYTHYMEGAGSIYSPKEKGEVEAAFAPLLVAVDNKLEHDTKKMKTDPLPLLKPLDLRFFTPWEVSNLMSFPLDKFSFPESVTNKQRYRLLGNSVNIKVVAYMIRSLFKNVSFE